MAALKINVGMRQMIFNIKRQNMIKIDVSDH